MPGDDHLARPPTLRRLETRSDRPPRVRRRTVALDPFIASFATPPLTLTFDLDAVDDEVHGQQQLSLFHGYYEQYQYLPLDDRFTSSPPVSWTSIPAFETK